MGSHHHPFSIPKASAALGTALIMESMQMIGAIVLARGRDPRCSIYLAVWLTTVSGKHMGTSHCFFGRCHEFGTLFTLFVDLFSQTKTSWFLRELHIWGISWRQVIGQWCPAWWMQVASSQVFGDHGDQDR